MCNREIIGFASNVRWTISNFQLRGEDAQSVVRKLEMKKLSVCFDSNAVLT